MGRYEGNVVGLLGALLQDADGRLHHRIVNGEMPGFKIIHKFGRNKALPTAFAPITIGGVWPTPQAAAATTVRIKSGGNANDVAGGSGARSVTVEGLDATGAEVSFELIPASTVASAASTQSIIRINRVFVSATGTYPTVTASTASHVAAITIEKSAGSEDWATIDATNFARGQSEMACYAVPLGKTAYVKNITVSTDSKKSTDIVMFQRRNFLDAVAPYSAMRVVDEYKGVAGPQALSPHTPLGPYPALTDLMFLGKSASVTPEADVHFEILLVDD